MAIIILKCVLALIAGCVLGYGYHLIKDASHKEYGFERTIDMMRGVTLFVVGMVLACIIFTTRTYAQDVTKNGNTFVQVSKKKPKDDVILTKYYYEIDGKKYPIFLSSKGKAFIKRISAKSGKEYRQYLPKITKQIAKEYGFNN